MAQRSAGRRHRPTPPRCSARHPGLAVAVAPARSERAQTRASRRATHEQRPPLDPVSQTHKAASSALPSVKIPAGHLRQPCSWLDAYGSVYFDGIYSSFFSSRSGIALSPQWREVPPGTRGALWGIPFKQDPNALPSVLSAAREGGTARESKNDP